MDLLKDSIPLDSTVPENRTLTIEEAGRLPLRTKVRVVAWGAAAKVRPDGPFTVTPPTVDPNGKPVLLTAYDKWGRLWYWTYDPGTLFELVP